MHDQSLHRWQHDHVFLGSTHERHEMRVWLVVGLTAIMMVPEIVGGTLYGSMALVADGWHMATHAVALAIAALAYLFARRYAGDPRFVFGTGKLGDLAAFSSAIILVLIAAMVAAESVIRLFRPVAIDFDEAIAIAAVGLAVNLGSAWLLRGEHDHHHDHADAHEHSHGHQDHNIRAAYIHVLADALTSILAIVGLVTARAYGWTWIDPLVGIVGTVVIAWWGFGLIRSSGAVLLDIAPPAGLVDTIRRRLETGGDRLPALHPWRGAR